MEIKIITTQASTNSLDTTREFGSFLLKTLSSIKMIHWCVLNHPVHVILGDLYDDLDTLFDSLQEEIIGTVRQNNLIFPKIISQSQCLDINDISQFRDDADRIIDTYFSVYKDISAILTSLELNTFITQSKNGINNKIEEVLSAFNKANYLISTVKI